MLLRSLYGITNNAVKKGGEDLVLHVIKPMLLLSLYGITNNAVKKGYLQLIIIHIATTTCMIGIMLLMNEY